MHFSYSPWIGFSIHSNEAEAKAKTESELKFAKLEAVRGNDWPVGTGSICYGKITHRATEVLESSDDYVALFNISDDYQIKPVDDGE